MNPVLISQWGPLTFSGFDSSSFSSSEEGPAKADTLLITPSLASWSKKISPPLSTKSLMICKASKWPSSSSWGGKEEHVRARRQGEHAIHPASRWTLLWAERGNADYYCQVSKGITAMRNEPLDQAQLQWFPLVLWANCDQHQNHRLLLAVLQSKNESFFELEQDWLSLRREERIYETKKAQIR